MTHDREPDAPDDPTPDGDVLDERAAAALLHVSPWTLSEMRKHGKAPPWRRVGKSVRYSRAAVLAWLGEQGQTG